MSFDELCLLLNCESKATLLIEGKYMKRIEQECYHNTNALD